MRYRSKRIRTPVALLRSLTDYYPSERYKPTYSPSYGLNSTTIALLQGSLWYRITHTKLDIPLNKETKSNQTNKKKKILVTSQSFTVFFLLNRLHKLKCKQPRSAFKLRSPIPMPTTITVTITVPKLLCIYIPLIYHPFIH